MLLKRVTTVPNTPLRILVDQSTGDGDVGMTQGGTFFFSPAGQDGDRAEVSRQAANVIMGDPKLAVHFECDPPLDTGQRADPEPVPDPVQADTTEQPRMGRYRRGRTSRPVDPADD